MVDREPGVEGPDEIRNGPHQAEVAEIARAVCGLREDAYHVLQRDVKECEREAREGRRDVERGEIAHEVRQHERGRAACGREEQERTRTGAVREGAYRPGQQQGEEIEKPAEYSHHGGRGAKLQRVEREHDAGRIQAGEEKERQGKREIDRHRRIISRRGWVKSLGEYAGGLAAT